MSGRRESGFTLVEAVIATAVAALLAVSAGTFIITAIRAQALAADLADAIDAGTLASQRIAMDLREMRAPAAVGLVVGPLGLRPSEIEFTVPGQDAPGTFGTVRYFVSADGDLVRNQAILLHRISGFAIQYLAESGAATTDPNQVRRIRFDFDVERGETGALHFGGQVFPRSLSPIAFDWREQ